jgi:surface antigen
MYARASNSPETFPSYGISDIDGDFGAEDFYAGEPVSPPHLKGPNVVPYTYLFLLLALAVGWGFASDSATRQQWTSTFEQLASAANNVAHSSFSPDPMASKELASSEKPAAPPPAAPPPATSPLPLPVVTVTEAPGSKPESSSEVTAKDAADALSPSSPSGQADPYRKRAEAAGLHPDLSRVLLARLSATDYRNAAFAIEKAVKTVPDDGEFTWPRSRKTGAAVFNVHFVQGTGHDCRRYVVTVTKDRWSTTALPMEKCGVKVAYRSPAKEKTIE